jgi:hypothetical protein
VLEDDRLRVREIPRIESPHFGLLDADREVRELDEDEPATREALPEEPDLRS